MQTRGELEGVFCECLLPLVEGSISSLELSGIINFKLGFLIWEFSILSSMASSFISLIFEGTIFIVWAGFNNLGWIFWLFFDTILDDFSSFIVSAKKSFGKIFLFIVFKVLILYIITNNKNYMGFIITFDYKNLVGFLLIF